MNVYIVTEQDDETRDEFRIVAVTATMAGAEKHVDALASQPGATAAWGITKWRILQEWEAADV